MDIQSTPVTLFLEALGAALKNETVSWTEEYTDVLWDDMFYLAERHLVLPMVFEAVRFSPAGQKLADMYPEYFEALQNKAAKEVVDQIKRTGELMSCYEFLTATGHRPLIMKGIVCRSLYPKPEYRQSWDEDLLIPPETGADIQRILKAYGMEPAKYAGVASLAESDEVPFAKTGSPLCLEVHRYLFPPDSDVSASWNQYFEDVFERAVEVQVGVDWTGTGSTDELDMVRTLEPTQNLFYIICHAFKHFLHEGTGMRQITDILVFANHYEDVLDFQKIWDWCREIRADGYLAAVLEIGRSFLHYEEPASHIPPDLQVADGDLQFFLYDVLDAGMQAQTSLSRMHSSNITLRAMQTDGEVGGSVLHTVFLPLKSMRTRYTYLNKAPFLLPVAWGQRIGQYLMDTRKNASGNSAEESIRIGKERVKLMTRLGMIQGHEDDSADTVDGGQLVSDRYDPVSDFRQSGMEAQRHSFLLENQKKTKKRDRRIRIGNWYRQTVGKIAGGPLAPLFKALYSMITVAEWHVLQTKWFLQGYRKPDEEEIRFVNENVTFIYKSFERQKMAKSLYRNIQSYYPGAKVIIADDSRSPLIIEGEYAEVIQLPFNRGLSYGLNRALERVKTPYVMRLDDDEMLCLRSGVGKQLRFLMDHKEVDMVSFVSLTAIRLHSVSFVLKYYDGQSMREAPEKLLIPHMTKIDEEHPVYGMGTNKYLAVTDKVRAVGYDDRIHVIDHYEFFYRAAGKLVNCTPENALLFHRHNSFDRNYLGFRSNFRDDQIYIREKHFK